MQRGVRKINSKLVRGNIPLSVAEDLLLKNANRLLADAKLLRRARRYPSAAAFAILGLEEVGKLILISNLFGRNRTAKEQDVRSHKSKQKAAAVAMMATMGVDEVHAIAEMKGYTFKIVPLDAPPSPSEKQIEDIFASMTDEDLKRTSRSSRNSKQNKFIVRAFRGDFDKIKQRAFYVDISKAGTPSAQPQEIDRETADRIIRLANRCLSAIKLDLKRRSRRLLYATHRQTQLKARTN